uniref:E3 ubiquitin-protein ligase PPP1R11 n=1 Tax=Molossus molossus TaxID=27622 RepID=A0A7J8GSN4_MOLMO|nr:protein phosphatase 1 regulatory inhibitor subunit 11 [Molossus molossus]
MGGVGLNIWGWENLKVLGVFVVAEIVQKAGQATWEDENRSLTIKLRKRKPEKKVEWTSDTVDNEHMGRRSSKCCCIYEKPRAFGESSTESDEEEEEGCGHTHCVRGHRKGRSRATPGPSPSTLPQPPDPSQPPPGPMQH